MNQSNGDDGYAFVPGLGRSAVGMFATPDGVLPLRVRSATPRAVPVSLWHHQIIVPFILADLVVPSAHGLATVDTAPSSLTDQLFGSSLDSYIER